MMKNPFKRGPRKPIKVELSSLDVTHVVRHEYGVRPRPVQAYLTITNKNGERWIAPAFTIYPGMSDVRFNSFPLQFVTGRAEDVKELPVDVRLTIDFERN